MVVVVVVGGGGDFPYTTGIAVAMQLSTAAFVKFQVIVITESTIKPNLPPQV